jgi:hypothetical protein
VKASKDQRVCQLFKADPAFFLGLGLTKMLNQEHDVQIRESAANFCLNVMKHNENVLLMHLVGIDLRARDYIFKK